MSETHLETSLPQTWPVPEVRRIGVADLREALARGWADFMASPTQLVFVGLLYPLVGFMAARAATGSLKPLLFPLLAGLTLMGPVAALGMYEISRQREAGHVTSWSTAFAALRAPGIGGIVVLGMALLVLFTFWLGAAQGIYDATMGPAVQEDMGDFLGRILHSPEGFRLIVIGNLVGALFAALVLAISVVSFPMMLDRNCGPAFAVQTSLRVAARNPVTIAIWGLIVVAILVLGALPALIGLAVAMPVLGHATWHLYRRAVV